MCIAKWVSSVFEKHHGTYRVPVRPNFGRHQNIAAIFHQRPTVIDYSMPSPTKDTMKEKNEEALVEHPSYCVLAFYQFFILPLQMDAQIWRQELDVTLRTFQARGAIRISIQEGMNGTICFPIQYQEAIVSYLEQQRRQQQPLEASISESAKLRIRVSYHSAPTFHRLSIRIKNEIVTMGPIPLDWISATTEDVNPQEIAQYIRPQRTGTYVSPGREWDALLHDPKCLVIDTRNDYEVQMGTFLNAVAPHTQEFTEFPSWLRERLSSKSLPYNKIAMFCTGGIRCEKATALCIQMMKSTNPSPEECDSADHGPIPVYHLEGGILAYLEQNSKDPSGASFVGECFVFDQRVAVTYGLQPTSQYVLCHACRRPVHIRDTQSTSAAHEPISEHPASGDQRYQKGVACPACFEQNQDRLQRYIDRQRQIELAQQRQVPHIYDAKEALRS
jgi:UPF0176 protein